jgi:hypothetical protein
MPNFGSIDVISEREMAPLLSLSASAKIFFKTSGVVWNVCDIQLVTTHHTRGAHTPRILPFVRWLKLRRKLLKFSI